MQFQTTSQVWTKRCGIISLNPKFKLTLLVFELEEGRYIMVEVQLHSNTSSTNTAP
jgi:hypothetical protein